MNTNRRSFIKIISGATLGLSLPFNGFATIMNERDKWGTLMPLKDFGSTGRKVTMMGVGGFHVGRMTDDEAQKTIELAIERGIRFFDNAESYVGGEAEIKYGKFLNPKYRDEVFLMTKTRARTKKEAQEHLEGSLKRMNTDTLDLWLIHAIDNENDVEERLNGGVLDYMLEAKQKGIVKHIGFSGHTTVKAHKRILELTNEMEACMMPINVVDMGYESYIENVLPLLLEQKKGVIAMKTLAGGSFFGRGFDGRHAAPDTVMGHISVDEAIQFALSVPNDVLVTGAKDAAMLEEKIVIAENFSKLSDDELQALFRKVSHLSGSKVEYYKS